MAETNRNTMLHGHSTREGGIDEIEQARSGALQEEFMGKKKKSEAKL